MSTAVETSPASIKTPVHAAPKPHCYAALAMAMRIARAEVSRLDAAMRRLAAEQVAAISGTPASA